MSELKRKLLFSFSFVLMLTLVCDDGRFINDRRGTVLAIGSFLASMADAMQTSTMIAADAFRINAKLLGIFLGHCS